MHSKPVNPDKELGRVLVLDFVSGSPIDPDLNLYSGSPMDPDLDLDVDSGTGVGSDWETDVAMGSGATVDSNNLWNLT